MSTDEKVNILMVDDQPAKLLSYEAILNQLNENLIKANSGREALEYMLKSDIAAVLMDVSMPEIDGFELARMIRQHPRFQKTAIIFISAVHLTDVDRLKGYALGAVDYISVPVVPEVLRAKVNVFADLHRKSRQLEALNAELRLLSGKLIAAQDEERRRVARQLHDELGQDLVAAKMMMDNIAQSNSAPPVEQAAEDASKLVGSAIRQVRSLSHLLHPPLLDEVGLRSALQWYVEGITKSSGIEITLDIQASDFPRLSQELETAIFRIIQEALTNVFRHSEAHNGSVSLRQRNGQVFVTVRDDGKGIGEQLSGLRRDGIGVGIRGMRQRANELGGELQITNANPGTLIDVTLPCKSVVPQEAGATI
jgi:signal transduction histidine kinase